LAASSIESIINFAVGGLMNPVHLNGKDGRLVLGFSLNNKDGRKRLKRKRILKNLYFSRFYLPQIKIAQK